MEHMTCYLKIAETVYFSMSKQINGDAFYSLKAGQIILYQNNIPEFVEEPLIDLR